MMSEKQFEIKVDDVDSSIIDITRDGEDFAWFLSDDITDKQVEKVVALLNEQQATIDQLNLAIDDLLSHTSCDEIKKENEQLKQEIIIYKKAFQEQVQRCIL